MQKYNFLTFQQNNVLIMLILKHEHQTFFIRQPAFFASCGTEKEKKQTSTAEKPAVSVDVPPFNADSAYFFVK
ncbi:MAG TPA: hypothetical protein VFO54_05130, partial [Chryseosolibacter sp.]|nr:hypothetical protein [Chryseosolibacter sp.]